MSRSLRSSFETAHVVSPLPDYFNSYNYLLVNSDILFLNLFLS